MVLVLHDHESLGGDEVAGVHALVVIILLLVLLLIFGILLCVDYGCNPL